MVAVALARVSRNEESVLGRSQLGWSSSSSARRLVGSDGLIARLPSRTRLDSGPTRSGSGTSWLGSVWACLRWRTLGASAPAPPAADLDYSSPPVGTKCERGGASKWCTPYIMIALASCELRAASPETKQLPSFLPAATSAKAPPPSKRTFELGPDGSGGQQQWQIFKAALHI